MSQLPIPTELHLICPFYHNNTHPKDDLASLQAEV